jgi:enoyl-CoA hydratase
MSEPVLLVEKRDGIATLTLNRPDQLNALSLELREALVLEMDTIRTDDSIGVVILTGAGRAFCAGMDLKEMGDPNSRSRKVEPPQPTTMMRSLPQPVIGAVNGLAITGGFEFLLSCDMLIATPAARFADTHARLGIIPSWGMSQRLPRMIGLNRAKELSLTGNYLSAELAYEWGLVNRVVAPEELMPTCIALATDILSCVPQGVRAGKRLIDHGYDMALGDAMKYEVDIARMYQSPPADVVAERRLAVQQRGREQAKK